MRFPQTRLPILGLMIGLMVPLAADAQTGADSGTGGKLAREVGAILVDKCVSCHGPDQKKGGLDLSRRAIALKGGKSGAAIVPGSPDESLLVEKVVEGEMPPKGSLAREQVAAVRAWVEAGAHYASEPLSPRRAGGGLVVAATDPCGVATGIAGEFTRGWLQRGRLGQDADRCLHPGRVEGQRVNPGARGRRRHVDTPRHV